MPGGGFQKTPGDTGLRRPLYGRIDRVDRDITSARYTRLRLQDGHNETVSAKDHGKGGFWRNPVHPRSRSLIPAAHLYPHLSGGEEHTVERVDAALILLGNNTDEVFLKGKDEKENIRLFDAYTSGIETVISHMLDPDNPFEAFDTDRCADCTARNLCHM